MTNGQLTLEVSVTRLCQKVNSIIKDMNDGEAFSRRVYPRVAQDAAFRNLRFNVSDFALKKLTLEWNTLH